MTSMDVTPVYAAIQSLRSHAKLSASGSKKWLNCTRSASVEQQFKEETSPFSAEGQFAHDVARLRICHRLGRLTGQQFSDEHARMQTSPYWSAELDDCVQRYVDFALELVEAAKTECSDPLILVEERLDLSEFIPEGFGTVDLLVVWNGTIALADYKHGRGVLVRATENSQLRLYGVAAAASFADLYDVKRVRMTVFQPRLNNFDVEELSVGELLNWAHNYVKPRAQLAWSGAGEFTPGSHCTEGFCKARYACAARAEVGLQVAQTAFTGVRPELLTSEQLVAVLDKADIVAKWLNDVREYALDQARRGLAIPKHKLVAGRSHRRFRDVDAVTTRLTNAGIAPASLYERNLIGVSAMERLLGRQRFNELLADLIERPEGNPTLVREDDPRPALLLNSGFSVITDDGSGDRIAATTHQE